jgi:glucokinase
MVDESDSDPQVLGIDVGGTDTKLGLVSASGDVSDFRRFPTDANGDSPDEFLQNLFSSVQELLVMGGQRIIGIGMSVHGYTDESRRGPILCFNTPALHGVDLKTPLENTFDLPVVINNDLTAHVLAEYTYGSGRGASRFLCLAIGTGLGAGVVVDGEPLRYVGGCAGDTGHVILEPGGPACSSGCRGCAEALCGVPGIERLALQAYGTPVAAHDVITAARRGDDARSISIMTQIGRYLGQTLASLSVIYLPERIALTGGTAEAGPMLLNAVQQQFEELVGDYHRTFARFGGDYYSGVEIVLGKTRGETGIVGAAVELLQYHLTRKHKSF